MSNAHVLCGSSVDDPFDVGDVVYQPGTSETSSTPETNIIGTLRSWYLPSDPAPAGSGAAASGYWGVALCTISGRPAKIGWVKDIGDVQIGTTPDLTDPSQCNVRKRGAVTQLTSGTITGLGRKAPVGFTEHVDPDDSTSPLVQPWYMFHLMTINGQLGGSFAEGGDSGSVLMNDSNEIVGLLSAGGGNGGAGMEFEALSVLMNITL